MALGPDRQVLELAGKSPHTGAIIKSEILDALAGCLTANQAHS